MECCVILAQDIPELLWPLVPQIRGNARENREWFNMSLFLPHPHYSVDVKDGSGKGPHRVNIPASVCYVCDSMCVYAPWMLEKSGGVSTPGHQDKDKMSSPTLYHITPLGNPIFPFHICIHCSFESSQNTAPWYLFWPSPPKRCIFG